MSNNKYKDFDQFFAQKEKAKKVIIKLFKKVYYLPSEIPASVMLKTYKMYKDGAKELNEVQTMEMAFAVLGKKNVEEWCKKGISIVQLEELLEWAIKQKVGEGDSSEGPKKK